MIDQFHRLGKMVAVTDHQAGIVLIDTDHNRHIRWQWKDEIPIHDHAYAQKTQEYLVPARDHDIIRWAGKLGFQNAGLSMVTGLGQRPDDLGELFSNQGCPAY